jgi:hypothetical protein
MVAFWPGRGWHALARPLIARLGAHRRVIRGITPAGGQRPWWKWLLIALLLAACITVTVLYATTVVGDIWRQHWAAAVDASREGVLAVVCWAAVIIVLSAGSRSAGRSASQPDGALTPQQDAAGSSEAGSLRRAQFRVHKLRARLAELEAARERAGSAADPDLDREVASTVARLERARQWLSSAQAAVAARRHQEQRAGGR